VKHFTPNLIHCSIQATSIFNIFQFIEVLQNSLCDIYIKIKSTGVLSTVMREKNYLLVKN
jgi:hypothetical protein